MPSIKGRLKKRFAEGGLAGVTAPTEDAAATSAMTDQTQHAPPAIFSDANELMANERARQNELVKVAGRRSAIPTQVQAATDLAEPMAMATVGGPSSLVEGVVKGAPLYSKLEKVVAEKMGGAASSDQLAAILRDVKPEELQYRKIPELLASKPKITKAELTAHLEANPVPQIEEIVKGAGPEIHSGHASTYGEDGDFYSLVSHPDENVSEPLYNAGPFATEDEALEDAQHALERFQANETPGAATIYSQYTLPGGENYREKLYTLPEQRNSARHRFDELNSKDHRFLSPQEFEEITKLREQIKDGQGEGANYRSSHWDEPNVLAHARVNDRVGPNGERLFHVEEIQSDWHQAGRKQGYKGDVPDKQAIHNAREEIFKAIEEKKKEANSLNPSSSAWEAKQAEINALRTKTDELGKQMIQAKEGVPDAPFKKTWHELTAKKLLKDAAEGGYDRLSWTPGEAQAARYDLSKQIDSVHYSGTNLKAYDHNGNTVINQTGISEDRLPDYIGKEAAEKLMAKKPNGTLRSLENADLKVGGEGMKGFYDKILPDYLNKLGKKYGVKVEQTALNGFSGDKHQIIEGADGFWHVIERRGGAYPKEIPNNEFNSEKMAANAAKKYLGGGDTRVHSIRITPEFRQAILKEGLPLFSVGATAIGAGQDAEASYAEGGMVSDEELAAAAAPMPETLQTPNQGLAAGIAPPSDTSIATSAQVNMMNPDGNLVSIPSSMLDQALSLGYSHPDPAKIQEAELQAKYGGAGQMALAGIEAVGRGVAGPLMTGAERLLGVDPEGIRGRQEASPWLSGTAEAAGLIGGAFTGGAQANLLSRAGKGLEAGLGLGKAGKISQFGAEATKGAFEAALYQAGVETHKAFTADPNQSAETALTDIGMSAVLGGLFGGPIGYALRPAEEAVAKVGTGNFVSGVDMPAIEAGDVRASIQASDAIDPKKKASIINAFDLGKKKLNAPEIELAAKAIGAPILPGMTSDDKLVQYGVDTLLNSPATYSGRRVIENYAKGYGAADNALQKAIESGSTESKAELGNQLKDSITGKIRAQYAPIKEAYDELAATHSLVPLEGDMAAVLAQQLKDIPEFRVAPSSPQGALVKQIFSNIKNVKNLDDLKILKDTLSLPVTASSQEKRMVGILRDKLGDIEEAAVERFAKAFPRNDEAGVYIQSLVDQKRALTPEYKKFITRLSELSEQLGKGRIHGTQDALTFLNERLTPEMVAQRLFAKKDSEFVKFFQKNFPEEFQQVRNYQRAEMRDNAKLHDIFSPNKFFNAFNKLEPEIQQALFTKQEIAKIKAAETYIQAFPKNFNPSGTSHIEAFREGVSSPIKWSIANARDYTIEQAIKMAEQTVEGKQAVALAKSTAKGEKNLTKAVKAVFSKVKTDMPGAVIPLAASRVKLDALVTEAAVNPGKLVAINDNNTSVPEYSSAFAAAAARTVTYLASLKPNTEPALPLDSKRTINSMEKATYDRALDIAQQPLVVLKHLQDGRITPFDVVSLQKMYPSLYQTMVSRLTDAIAEKTRKGEIIPYNARMGLSIFLGQPLDSTMTPEAIMSIQMGSKYKTAQDAAANQAAPAANKTKGLEKQGVRSQTATQAREAERSSGK